MRIFNKAHLAGLPDEVIQEVARFVRPTCVHNVVINIRRVEWGMSHGNARVAEGPIVVNVWLAPAPHRMARQGAYLGSPPIGSVVEQLVFILAHELRHVWQFEVPQGHRVWGARGRYSERDADAYAIRMLRKWRRDHPQGGRQRLDLSYFLQSERPQSVGGGRVLQRPARKGGK